ncbi:hypothetical protein D0Y65_033835, partial [Glycine soja]
KKRSAVWRWKIEFEGLFLGVGVILRWKIEYQNLPFDSSAEDVKKQYRKMSLMVQPDKCKHPQTKEAFAEELRAKRKKQLKKDTAPKIKSLVEEISEEEGRLRRDEEEQKELWKEREQTISFL